jgi:hypothetical protein
VNGADESGDAAVTSIPGSRLTVGATVGPPETLAPTANSIGYALGVDRTDPRTDRERRIERRTGAGTAGATACARARKLWDPSFRLVPRAVPGDVSRPISRTTRVHAFHTLRSRTRDRSSGSRTSMVARAGWRPTFGLDEKASSDLNSAPTGLGLNNSAPRSPTYAPCAHSLADARPSDQRVTGAGETNAVPRSGGRRPEVQARSGLAARVLAECGRASQSRTGPCSGRSAVTNRDWPQSCDPGVTAHPRRKPEERRLTSCGQLPRGGPRPGGSRNERECSGLRRAGNRVAARFQARGAPPRDRPP